MERIATLHIERLPEGAYLATSDDIQGLIAQGRTIQETIEIARDVAKKLIELRDGDEAVSRQAAGPNSRTTSAWNFRQDRQ